MVDLLFDHEQHCIDYDYEHRCAEHEHDILSLWLLLGAFLKPPAPQVVANRHGHFTAVPFSRADWLDETALIHNQVEHGENDSSRRDISNKALGKSMRAKRALTQPRVQ